MKIFKKMMYCILISAILTACNNNSKSETKGMSELASAINPEAEGENVLPTDSENTAENITDTAKSINNKNEAAETGSVSINPDKLIYKIWEIKVENEADNAMYLSPTFCITSITKNEIKGKIATGGGLIYWGNSSDEQYSGAADLIGVIDDNKAECEFDYGNGGDKGKIELTFLNDKEIRGEVCYENRNTYNPEIFFPDGIYTFRPRNIEDLCDNGRAEIVNRKSLPVRLSLWGDVNITTGYLEQKTTDTPAHPHAVAYVTDYEGNILYEFTGLVNGVEIYDVTTEDLNNDGLSDVQISFDVLEPEMLVYTYFQMENGLFYLAENPS